MASAYILVVDDEPDIRTLLKEILEDEGYEVEVADSGAAARSARRTRRPDLILLDIWMPDVDGISLFKEWIEADEVAVPVIMISGHGTVDTAVEATRLGAYDFIEKPLSLGRLLVTVRRALESYQLRQENLGLRRQTHPLPEPIGKSRVMNELRERVSRVAPHDSAILIQGELGSGKGTVAKYLHAYSARADGPFTEVAVGSLSNNSPDTALFGSEQEQRVHFGLLEQANGGTLFLDDVADMQLGTQARLLSALETGSYIRMGGIEPVQINVRVVASTRYDLEQRVREGQFRSDLYYHLNVVPLYVPALREHLEDIPELISFFIGYFVDHDKLPYRAFTVAAQNRLRHYEWPGNLRELQNLVQRLLIVGTGNQVEMAEVEAALGGPPRAGAAAANSPGPAVDRPLREARELFERQYFERLLQEMNGSMQRVAQRAGIERTHLYRKLRALDIDVKAINSNKR